MSDSRIKHLTYEIWLQREGRKQFDLHVQSLLSVTPGSFPQRISTSVRALSLPKDTQANTSSSFSVVEPSDEPNAFINSALSYLHSCRHGSQYPNLELALSNTVSPYSQGHNTPEQHASVMQAPVAQMSCFQSYAHAEKEHSTGLSLPSAMMGPEYLEDDIAPDAELELFGDYTAEEFGDFLRRAIYSRPL